MADLTSWPPERLRALDRAVAEARGWTLVGPHYWMDPWGGLWSEDNLPPVSLGCRETFDLMEAFRNVTWELRQDRLGRFLFAWVDDVSGNWGAPVMAPTMPIAICLAHLASKGRPFNG